MPQPQPSAKPKRNPTVLVTDARDASLRPAEPAPWSRPSNRPLQSSRNPQNSTKLISVDNVLQFSSEIPSQQRRGPPSGSGGPSEGFRPAVPTRTPSGKHPLNPRLAGIVGPGGGLGGMTPHLPSRSSKVSERLVVLPDTSEKHTGDDDDDDEEDGSPQEESESIAPPNDAELRRRKRGMAVGPKDKSYAERLPKQQRAQEDVARVTAYATAQSYKLMATAEFLKAKHGARTKLYDDCLYVVYHLPLLKGEEGYRVRSSPVLKRPGGGALLDEVFARSERRGGYREDEVGDDPNEVGAHEVKYHEEHRDGNHRRPRSQEGQHSRSPDVDRRGSNDSFHHPPSPNDSSGVPASSLLIAEAFLFSYGVAVFWNLTERQEKDILADLTFSPQMLSTRPMEEADFETEEFHFEYNTSTDGTRRPPRVFNDMITLRSRDPLIKLAMSHAIAQSTKLSFFEQRMSDTMAEAQHVPRRLALTGHLGMKREEVVRITGKLFTSRVAVNLSSNMLDVPNFFWDAEPTLHPLYSAVREYLEITPRVTVLNERCRVFLDLAEILSDAIADSKMTRITWIIIILIVLSICVTCSEVLLRFGLLSKEKGHSADPSPSASVTALAGFHPDAMMWKERYEQCILGNVAAGPGPGPGLAAAAGGLGFATQ